MEVHQHAHTARKKWTHYFWEFFMLFLAVTLGFFVENRREHSIERQREKQYIHSMIEDLKLDTGRLAELIINNTRRLAGCDSLLTAMRNYGTTKNAGLLYYYHLEYMLRGWYFQPTERTLQQLKNAGGLRLIHKQAASDTIVDYDNSLRGAELQGQFVQSLDSKYLDLSNTVYDFRELFSIGHEDIKTSDLKLLTTDNRILGTLYNSLGASYGSTIAYTSLLGEVKQKAARTIASLKKEYRLE